MINSKLYILFGAPGSGKSLACELLKEITADKLKIIQKETTRPSRDSDGLEITTVDCISKKCDFRYSQYGYDYGFSSLDIWNNFKKGVSTIVIVNDIRTIRLLNKKFGCLAQSIYVHSNIDREKIEEISKKRYPKANEVFLAKDVAKRIEKIKTIHRKYIENTYLFNSAVINIYKTNDNNSIAILKDQLVNLYNRDNRKLRSLSGSPARILLIVGASFSGKDELVNAMMQIEPSKIALYRKATTRPKNKKDKDELIHLKSIPKSYDVIYEKNGFSYGLSTKKIWSELSKEKIVLIIVSDLDSIEKLKKEFYDVCSVIYLHSNVEKEELEEARKTMSEKEFTKRKNSIAELLKVYFGNMNIFDHVLLNTSESEDLYDQAFNILDFYLENKA